VRDALRAIETALDRTDRAGLRLPFWWRDDDAVEPSPALDRLLALAEARGLPLALAVIPARAVPALAERLAEAPRAAVLQHGYAHARHERPGGKKAELGDDRPLALILAELAEGRARLRRLVGPALLPVLVPPWNRIGEAVRAGRAQAGLPRLSVFGPSREGAPAEVNTHLDIIDWKSRAGLPHETAAMLLAREIARRTAGDPEPVGLLTHHLVHDGQAWALLEDLLGLLAGHPAVHWPEPGELFAARTALTSA